MTTALKTQATSHWRAHLQLHYGVKNSATILQQRKHSGPLMVQKPFYPEQQDCCHTYIVHPPGGIVGGDELTVDIHVDHATNTLFTTPAATKFYRSNGACARQTQHIVADDSACIEWLPQETVYFDQSIVHNHTRIDLQENSRLIAWDIQCLGLPASLQPFKRGHCIQRFEIYRNTQPILMECNRFIGGSSLLSGTFGLQGKQALGTLVASCDNQELIETLRSEYNRDTDPILIAFTYFRGFLICRALADFSYQIQPLFRKIWKIIRPLTLKREATEPRIWNT